MRFSRQRQVISDILRNSQCHPEAEWVYREAKKKIPNISLGTVYRNLKCLTDTGEVITLETELGSLRYDGDLKDHAHFVCNNCKKIYDILLGPEIYEEIEKAGHHVESGKFIFYGTCCACRDTSSDC